MINWYRKRKLIGLVEKLAIYNDKGISWRNHNTQQVEAERQRLISSILYQINKLGEHRISTKLLSALKNGSLETDMTGMFIAHAKQTKL
jgi:uncharacterized membrane protein